MLPSQQPAEIYNTIPTIEPNTHAGRANTVAFAEIGRNLSLRLNELRFLYILERMS